MTTDTATTARKFRRSRKSNGTRLKKWILLTVLIELCLVAIELTGFSLSTKRCLSNSICSWKRKRSPVSVRWKHESGPVAVETYVRLVKGFLSIEEGLCRRLRIGLS